MPSVFAGKVLAGKYKIRAMATKSPGKDKAPREYQETCTCFLAAIQQLMNPIHGTSSIKAALDFLADHYRDPE